MSDEPTITLTTPRYTCDKHGEHDATIQIRAVGTYTTFCTHCLSLLLRNEIGIMREVED